MKTRWMSFKQKILLAILLLAGNTAVLAQDGSVTGTERQGSNYEWYTSVWVWVIAAAIFILVFMAILKEDNNRMDA